MIDTGQVRLDSAPLWRETKVITSASCKTSGEVTASEKWVNVSISELYSKDLATAGCAGAAWTEKLNFCQQNLAK